MKALPQVENVAKPVQPAVHSNQTSASTCGPLTVEQESGSSKPEPVASTFVKVVVPSVTTSASAQSSLAGGLVISSNWTSRVKAPDPPFGLPTWMTYEAPPRTSIVATPSSPQSLSLQPATEPPVEGQAGPFQTTIRESNGAPQVPTVRKPLPGAVQVYQTSFSTWPPLLVLQPRGAFTPEVVAPLVVPSLGPIASGRALAQSSFSGATPQSEQGSSTR